MPITSLRITNFIWFPIQSSKGRRYQFRNDIFKVKRVFIAPANMYSTLSDRAIGDIIFGNNEIYINNPSEPYEIYIFFAYKFPTFYLRYETFIA